MSTSSSQPELETKAIDQQVIDRNAMEKLVSRNLWISVFAKIFHLVTRFFIPPLVLSFIGLEEFGIWAICFTIISYLGLGAFGISNVYIRYVAEYHASHQIQKVNELISTGMFIVVSVMTAFLVGFWFLLPYLIEEVFNIPDNLHKTAFILFYGTACIFVFDMSLGVFKFILNGLQKIAEVAFIWVGCLTLETILIVIFLFLDFGIYSLFLAYFIKQFISFTLYMILAFKVLPGLSISFKHIKKSYLGIFYRFGGIVQIGGILGVLLNSIDKIIGGITLNMSAVGIISIGTRLPAMARTIPNAMNAVFLPATSYMHTQHRHQEMLDMFLRGARSISLLTGFIMAFLTAYAHLILVAWLGIKPEYTEAAILMSYFAIPQHFHVLTGPGSAFFKGIERPSLSLIYPILRLSLITSSIIIFTNFFEITLISLILIISIVTIASATAYILYINNFLEVSNLQFFKRVILPGITSYIIAFSLYGLSINLIEVESVLQNRWHAIGFVLTSGIIYSFVTFTVMYNFIYDQNERKFIKRKFRRLLKRIGLMKKNN